jgi:hypothetical protein
MKGAPIVIDGWDEDNQYWAARCGRDRDFKGVQGLGDAFMASRAREVDLVISDAVWAEMAAMDEAPHERPAWALRPPNDPPVG